MAVIRPYVFVAALMFVLLNSSHAASGTSGFLKILTYNIQGMRPGSDPSTRLSFIIRNLERIDPDIIGLQEINETKTGGGSDNQARVIAESLSSRLGVPYSWYSSATHDAWDGQFIESIGIVTKHRVLASGFRDLQQAEFPRKVVWNLVETPLGRVHFFTTHFSNSSGAARVVQANQVKDYIGLQEASQEASATILTGDFNDEPESSTLRVFTGENRNGDFFDTFNYANPAATGFTIDASAPSRRIDFILYKRTGEFPIEASIVEMDVPYSPGKYCSDHLAVLTTLSMGSLVAPRRLTFSSVPVGTTDTTGFVLGNWGTRPLVIESVESGLGPFRVPGVPPMPVTLPTRDFSLRLQLTFSPTDIGLSADSITIRSDDPVKPVMKIAVRGRGIGRVIPPQVGRCYAVSSSGGGSQLWTLDLATGSTTRIVATDIAPVSAISVRPSTGDLLAISSEEFESNLYRISVDSGYCVRLRTLPIGKIRAMGVSPGDTLLVGTVDGLLYRAGLVGGLPVQFARVQDGFGVGALCYDPASEQFWLTLYAWPFTNDSLFVLNPWSGQIAFRGSSGQMIVTPALTVDTSGVLYGLTGTAANLLQRFDKATGSSVLVGFDPYENFIGLAIRWPPGTTATGLQPGEVPLACRLFQNYPNPFNPETVIRYQVPAPSRVEGSGLSDVKLVVYDVLGREVATLVNEVKEPGTYTVQFSARGASPPRSSNHSWRESASGGDASNLASGIYLYRLTAGPFSQAKKLLLLR